MKEGEEEKTKTYSALIWTDKAIQKEDIAFLDDIKVSVACFANLYSTCPGALGESLYTCSHGDTSFSVGWFGFLLIQVPLAIGTFIPPPILTLPYLTLVILAVQPRRQVLV